MDYTEQSLLFKIRKLYRYIKLYGIKRSLIKVKGQYHMKNNKSFEGKIFHNNNCKNQKSSDRVIAIVGCGNFAYSNIAYYLFKKNKNFLRATYDIDKSKSLSLCENYNGLYASESINDIINDDCIKLVYIASNHYSHAIYAAQFISANKIVHIEKPHAVSYDQLSLLYKSYTENKNSQILLGFNRPKSKLFKILTSYLDKESGPLMINWFIAGHQIEDNHWYFDKKEGGRVLGNLCHWSDLILHIVKLDNCFPCVITSSNKENSKSDFVCSISFSDGSASTISFSAKGHTFEGVREILNVHKGNTLGMLKDFATLELDIIEKIIKKKLFFRDHGHKKNILNSYNALFKNNGEDIDYVMASGIFILAIRDSIETGQKVTVEKKNTGKYSVRINDKKIY